MKKVLYWADFDFKQNYSRRLIRKLNERCPDYEITNIEGIWKLAHDDFDISEYDIILLQSTDVTKFSAEEKQIEKIGDRLEDFLDDGKKLIVSHDVIYRRTRNERLQDMYNYRIKNFARTRDVEYFKTSFCKQTGAFSTLSDAFTLCDGEVCWGDIDEYDDKMIFMETVVKDPANEQMRFVPTVFGKKYNGGSLIWFNTGDTFDGPPKAIANMDDNFVKLLAECLEIDLYSLKSADHNNGKMLLTHLKECDKDKPFVFISYCDSNADRVYEICLMLDYLGVNYFIDKKNIISTSMSTEGWKTEIKNALNHPNCSAALVFLSEEFFDSINCVYEIEQMNLLKDKFDPVILSVSLSVRKIPKIIDTWRAADLNKISLFRDLLSLNQKPNTTEWEVNQLVFNCHRDLSQFNNLQLVNTLVAKCNITDDKIYDKNYIKALIEKCKSVSKN